VLGILKKELVEIKYPRCGALNLCDPKRKALVRVVRMGVKNDTAGT